MGDFSILAMRIKELRASIGKTQREFANFVGCTAATLSAYENGSKSPSLEIVKNIAEKCEVSIDWLCGLSENKNLNNDFKTCSDIATTLLKIDQSTDILLGIEADSDCPYLSFEDSSLNRFLREWIDASNVLYNSLIKQEIAKSMYDSWLKSKLEELNSITLHKTILDAEGEPPAE